MKVAIAPGGASSAVIGASLRGRGASSIPPQTELPGTRRLSFLRRVDHGECAEGRSTAPAVTKRAKRGVHPPSAVPVREAAKCAPRGVEDEGDAVTHGRIRKAAPIVHFLSALRDVGRETIPKYEPRPHEM